MTSILQRALVNDPAAFGEIVPGHRGRSRRLHGERPPPDEDRRRRAEHPAGVVLRHRRTGRGAERHRHPSRRSRCSGRCFPTRRIDYKSDVRVLAAQRWPTVIPEDRVPARDRRAALSREPGGDRQGRHARVLLQHAGVVHAARRPHQAERDLGLGSARRIRRHALRVLQGHARARRGPPDAGRSLPARALRRSRGGRGQGRRCSPPSGEDRGAAAARIQASASRIAAPTSTSPSRRRFARATKRTSPRSPPTS